MKQIPFWQLGWQTLLRDLRSGELRVLLLSVALAVAALTSVGFFADRIKGGLQRDARQLLGGDAVVVSDNTPPASFTQRAQGLGLAVASSAAPFVPFSDAMRRNTDQVVLSLNLRFDAGSPVGPRVSAMP